MPALGHIASVHLRLKHVGLTLDSRHIAASQRTDASGQETFRSVTAKVTVTIALGCGSDRLCIPCEGMQRELNKLSVDGTWQLARGRMTKHRCC